MVVIYEYCTPLEPSFDYALYYCISQEEMDVADLEMRLQESGSAFGALCATVDRWDLGDMRRRERALLGFVLASGLYPQLAIGDETLLTSLSGDGCVFFTRDKCGLVLHPSSLFVRHHELLRPETDRALERDAERHLRSVPSATRRLFLHGLANTHFLPLFTYAMTITYSF